MYEYAAERSHWFGATGESRYHHGLGKIQLDKIVDVVQDFVVKYNKG